MSTSIFFGAFLGVGANKVMFPSKSSIWFRGVTWKGKSCSSRSDRFFACKPHQLLSAHDLLGELSQGATIAIKTRSPQCSIIMCDHRFSEIANKSQTGSGGVDSRPESGPAPSDTCTRGGLVFKAHALLYYATLGSSVMQKKRRTPARAPRVWSEGEM